MFAQTNANFEQAKTERKASYTRRLVDIVVSNDRTLMLSIVSVHGSQAIASSLTNGESKLIKLADYEVVAKGFALETMVGLIQVAMTESSLKADICETVRGKIIIHTLVRAVGDQVNMPEWLISVYQNLATPSRVAKNYPEFLV